jgi:NADPH:quinone reductase-like Zn-dependent oxidoreductase
MAKLAGAHVTAVSASPDRAQGLTELGADDVIDVVHPTGREFDAIVEGVGGATLGACVQRVTPGGTIVSFASSDAAPVQFPPRSLFGRAPGARLYGLLLFAQLERSGGATSGLARLVELVGSGRLECSLSREAPWSEAAEEIAALLARKVRGKAVLTVPTV